MNYKKLESRFQVLTFNFVVFPRSPHLALFLARTGRNLIQTHQTLKEKGVGSDLLHKRPKKREEECDDHVGEEGVDMNNLWEKGNPHIMSLYTPYHLRSNYPLPYLRRRKY